MTHIIYQQGVNITGGRESAAFHRTTAQIGVFHVVIGRAHTHTHRVYNFWQARAVFEGRCQFHISFPVKEQSSDSLEEIPPGHEWLPSYVPTSPTLVVFLLSCSYLEAFPLFSHLEREQLKSCLERTSVLFLQWHSSPSGSVRGHQLWDITDCPKWWATVKNKGSNTNGMTTG